MKLRFPSRLLLLLSLFALIAAWSVPASAQDARSPAAAKELAQLMTSKKIDSLAARMPEDREQFVGALSFPGSLMVVWAKTTAPAVVNEKLIRKEYREVYMDLNSASIAESRHFITDIGADGLRVKPETKGGPSDTHDTGAKGSIRFDGNWKEDKMSEADYMKAYAEADAAYAKAIDILLAELKKAG
ncbi:MAG: hypothetical protein ABI665_23675 [Vicinamibacterales bacterium]